MSLVEPNRSFVPRMVPGVLKLPQAAALEAAACTAQQRLAVLLVAQSCPTLCDPTD